MIFRPILLTIIILLLPGLAFSGSIKGEITYSAEVKLPKGLDTGKYQKACGPEVANEKLLVNGKGLMNAVVTLEGKKTRRQTGRILNGSKRLPL